MTAKPNNHFVGGYKVVPKKRRELIEALVAAWDRRPNERFGQFLCNLDTNDKPFFAIWDEEITEVFKKVGRDE